MMTPELDLYIRQHSDPEPDYLHRLDRLSNIRLLNGRMCSGHLQGRVLSMLVSMIRPKRVLELGTFTGYSALCIAEALPEDGTLVTLEVNDELEDFILENLSQTPAGSKVKLLIGDAIETMNGFDDEEFDLVFIDADKRKYVEYYEIAMRLIPSCGYILADNTLWDGHVVEPDHLHDPQTAGIVAFNDLVARDPRVSRVMLPMRDGLTIIRKL